MQTTRHQHFIKCLGFSDQIVRSYCNYLMMTLTVPYSDKKTGSFLNIGQQRHKRFDTTTTETQVAVFCYQVHLLVNTMRSSDGPVLVQQCSPALVQIGGGSPLSQRYLPRPLSEAGSFAPNYSGFGESPSTADCRQQKRRC